MTIPTVKLYTLNTSASNTMVRMNVLGSHTGITVSSAMTTYKSESIWAVFKQGEAYVYGFDDIKDAGTYTLRVYNGISNTSNANFKYDILDTTNKIVAYKVDNKYYDANYRTSLWQPTYTYTINKKEVYGAWQSMANAVDGGTLAEPKDFTYTGSAFNFSYTIKDIAPVDQHNYQIPFFILHYASEGRQNIIFIGVFAVGVSVTGFVFAQVIEVFRTVICNISRVVGKMSLSDICKTESIAVIAFRFKKFGEGNVGIFRVAVADKQYFLYVGSVRVNGFGFVGRIDRIVTGFGSIRRFFRLAARFGSIRRFFGFAARFGSVRRFFRLAARFGSVRNVGFIGFVAQIERFRIGNFTA